MARVPGRLVIGGSFSGIISFDSLFSLHTVTYSFLDNSDNGLGEEDLQKYKLMEKKDKRRWKLADVDAVSDLLSRAKFKW